MADAADARAEGEASGTDAAPTADEVGAWPLARPSFSFYALVHDGGDRYGSHLLPLGACATVKEFFQYLNHLPAPGQVFDGRHGWKIGGKHWGYGVCFFETPTRPEWEDPSNAHGVDLVCRGAFAPAALSEAWRSLLLLLVNGELEVATGARLACKPDRRGAPAHKLEVWCRAAADAPAAAAALRAALGLDFATVPRRKGR